MKIMNFPVLSEAKTLQFLCAKAALDLPAFRLHNKTLQSLSTPRSKPIIVRHNFRSYCRFPEDFYSDVQVNLSLSVTRRVRIKKEHDGGIEFDYVESIENLPLMEVGCGTSRVRAKQEQDGGIEFDYGVEKIESPSRMEVGFGTRRVRTNQEHDGGIEFHYRVEKVESPSRMDAGFGTSHVRTNQEHDGGIEFDYGVEKIESPSRMEVGCGISGVRTKQEQDGGIEFDYGVTGQEHDGGIECDYGVETFESPLRMEVVRTKKEHDGGVEFHYGVEKFERSSPMEANCETSRVRTKQERDGDIEFDYGVENFESPSRMDVVRTKQEHAGGIEFDYSAKNFESPSRMEVGCGTSPVSTKQEHNGIEVFDQEKSGCTDEEQRGEIGTMKRWTTKIASRKAGKSWLPKAVKSMKLADVCGRFDVLHRRIRLPGLLGGEVERVLGGGIVPGTLVLVGGDPGVGKSTLLLQISALIAEGDGTDAPARVLYVSGEESAEQIGSRADRLCIKTEEVFLYSSTDIEVHNHKGDDAAIDQVTKDILEQAQYLSPTVIVIDSIQTAYKRGVNGCTGGPRQVKECTFALLRFAKETNIPIILIGHVTKTGCVAGPRTLEHAVDVVLYVEGGEIFITSNASIGEEQVGVFKMSESGLQGVLNPSKIFLVEQHSDSRFLVGCAVAVIMEGSRAFLIQIQASCEGCKFSKKNGNVAIVNGAKASRVDMIISAIRNQVGLDVEEGIFLNVVNGVCLKDGGGDLAIAAAMCSSLIEIPIPEGIAFIAEVGLGGELLVVPQMEKRINTVAKLGYKKCIVPYSREKSFSDLQLEGMEILECNNLKEMVHNVFGGY